MDYENSYPLSVYQELEPLCEKGHVMLVHNRQDGQLYVKKQVQSYAPDVYSQLREHPVKNTPVLYGIYQDPEAAPEAPGALPLILIEEYLPGRTLAEHLRERGVFSQEECRSIGLQLCRILMELHSRKPAILHRDIKPSNVMLLPDGTVKLLDFSAAKIVSNNEKRDTVLIGTQGFAAPEQYGFSASTPQTDLYALGVLLNTLLTGRLPWEQASGGRLRHIITRCLQMKPADRYAGAWELHAALKRAKRLRIPWFLPGFRTLRWYKMIPAFLWYSFVFVFAFRADFSTADLPVRIISRLILLLLGLLPVLFYGNYLDIQRFFPFMRSHSLWLRMLGLVLALPLLFLLMLLIIVAVTALFL